MPLVTDAIICSLRNHKQIWRLQAWTSHQFADFLIVSNKSLLNLENEHQQRLLFLDFVKILITVNK